MAANAQDVRAAQELRHLVFIDGRTLPRAGAVDADDFDDACDHVLVEDGRCGTLVAAFRLLSLSSGRDIGRSYAAQFYDLAPLGGIEAPLMEMGRFCVRPGVVDPDILRMAWREVARIVSRNGVEMLFGCTSFRGTDPAAYGDTFALLRQAYVAPQRWRPRMRAPRVVRFCEGTRTYVDRRSALAAMPPLLRSYLAMGGRVSDHAVIDPDLDTLHVFTGLEVRAVPARRRASLMAAGT